MIIFNTFLKIHTNYSNRPSNKLINHIIHYSDKVVNPTIAVIEATIFPSRVNGSLSPYPTVAIVTIHHHIAWPILFIFLLI